MKFIDKNKKALTLIEVMIFFVVSSVLLMLTLPAMTQKKTQEVCTQGGRVIFDGTKNIIGDKSGVVRVDCKKTSSGEICEYWWKAPTTEVYITSVGGGGGGSGVNSVLLYEKAEYLGCGDLLYKKAPSADPNSNDILQYMPAGNSYGLAKGWYCVDHNDYDSSAETRFEYPLCLGKNLDANPAEDYDAFGLKYPIDPSLLSTYQNDIAEQLKKYFTNYSLTDLSGDLASKYDKDNAGDLGEHKTDGAGFDLLYCKIRTGSTLKHVFEPCATIQSGSDAGKEAFDTSGSGSGSGYTWADCNGAAPPPPAPPLEPSPSNNYVNGAGGMGGDYVFGANFDGNFEAKSSNKAENFKEAYFKYMKNQANPIVVKRGEVYKIIVGQGGAPGKKGSETYLDHEGGAVVCPKDEYAPGGYKQQPYSVLHGAPGGSSCVIARNAPSVCNSCDKFADVMTPDCKYYIYAFARGGEGAMGLRKKLDFAELVTRKDMDSEGSNGTKMNYTASFAGAPGQGPIGGCTRQYYMKDTDNEWAYRYTNPEFYYIHPSSTGGFTLNHYSSYNKALGELYARLGSFISYAPQQTGQPGSFFAPGKGGPSLYGMDRPGAGGDGRYLYKDDSGNVKESPESESKGHDGLVELRWFTTCE